MTTVRKWNSGIHQSEKRRRTPTRTKDGRRGRRGKRSARLPNWGGVCQLTFRLDLPRENAPSDSPSAASTSRRPIASRCRRSRTQHVRSLRLSGNTRDTALETLFCPHRSAHTRYAQRREWLWLTSPRHSRQNASSSSAHNKRGPSARQRRASGEARRSGSRHRESRDVTYLSSAREGHRRALPPPCSSTPSSLQREYYWMKILSNTFVYN